MLENGFDGQIVDQTRGIVDKITDVQLLIACKDSMRGLMDKLLMGGNYKMADVQLLMMDKLSVDVRKMADRRIKVAKHCGC